MEGDLNRNLELRIKKVGILIVGILNIVISICLNFNELLMGGPVKLKNIVVSLAYLLIWFLIIFFAYKIKSKKLLKIFLGFWIFDFIVIILFIIIVKLDIYGSLIIPFIIICFGPLYGFENFSTVVPIIISILN
ncbi:hypothetical protein R0131_11860, partial [Clostridium sp. AL.422]|uniref:hypothetical protein n=1 Tax=Clostridium TaxID=1485 RepID=UPI00293DEBE6